jgi:nicotinamidase-related amidase
VKGLLILDIQNDFTGAKARMPVSKLQAEQMIASLNRLISQSKEKGLEVIYIGNEFSKNDLLNIFRNFAAIKGQQGSAMDPRLQVINKNYFPKSSSNAFSNKALLYFLQEKNITELIITGLYAEACVWQTMKGALKNNFTVTTIADCVASRSDKKREKMLNRYRRHNIAVLREF